MPCRYGDARRRFERDTPRTLGRNVAAKLTVKLEVLGIALSFDTQRAPEFACVANAHMAPLEAGCLPVEAADQLGKSPLSE